MDLSRFIAQARRNVKRCGLEGEPMKPLQVELPDKPAAELAALVQAGWFTSESEVVRPALTEYVQHHRYALLEQFQREDIAWALQQQSPDA